MMSKDIAIKAISWLLTIAKHENSSPTIVFFGGEPLLNFNILRYVIQQCRKFEKEGFPKTNFIITTNGSLLDKKIAHFFKRENVKVSISLDGNENIHKYQRKNKNNHNNYQTIINNCKYLFDINADVAIKATITKVATNSKNIVSFFENLNIPYRLSPVLLENNETGLMLDKNNIEDFIKEECDCFCENISKKNIRINNIGFLNFLKIFFNSSPIMYPCNAGTSYIALDVNGNFYPCHRFLGKKEYRVGNLSEGIDYNKNNIFTGHLVNDRNECKNCEINLLCGGTCYYESLLKSKTYCHFKKVSIMNASKIFFNHNTKIIDLIMEENNTINKESNIQLLKIIEQKKDISKNFANYIFSKLECVKLVDLEDSGILFYNNKKYIVNITSMAILDLLNSERTAQEIVNDIANACEINIEDIEEDIYNQLATFQELGFVEEVNEIVEKNV